MVFTLNLLINIGFIYYFITILVNQFYSVSRFLRVTLLILKKNWIIFCLLFLSILFIKVNKYIPFLIGLILLVTFYIFNKPIKIKLTRRNITLLSVSVIVSSLFIFNVILFPLFNIILGYYITYPVELLIRNIYFKKAKNKLSKVNPIVLGITGSYGKTSFKYLLSEVLKTKYIVSVPKGNINTPNGIAKFINNELKEDTEVLIVELGIDQINGMEVFKKYLSLDVAIITSIGENHIANFKSLDNTFKAKFKIKELLKENGKLYINNDSIYLKDIRLSSNVLKFSRKNFINYPLTIEGLKLTYNSKEFMIPMYGEYIYSYLDGVIKISEFLGINKDCIELGIRNIKPLERRLEVKKMDKGFFINDSYNINIKGVKESLSLLNTLKGNSVIITGGITEQGKYFYKQNKNLQELFKNQNVIFIGKNDHPLIDDNEYKKLYVASSLNEAYRLVKENKFNNILLLSKGEDVYLR